MCGNRPGTNVPPLSTVGPGVRPAADSVPCGRVDESHGAGSPTRAAHSHGRIASVYPPSTRSAPPVVADASGEAR